MLQNKLDTLSITQFIEDVLNDINSIDASLYNNFSANIRLTQFTLSNNKIINNDMEYNIIQSSIDSIDQILKECFGTANTHLNALLKEYKCLTGIINSKNDNTSVMEKIRIDAPKTYNLLYTANSNGSNSKQQAEFVKENNNVFDRNLFDIWLLKNVYLPPIKNNLIKQYHTALTKFNSQINKPLTDSILIMTIPRIQEVQIELDNIKTHENKARTLLQEIEESKDKTNKLAASVADAAINGHYAKRSNSDEKTSSIWMIASISMIVIAIGWLCFLIYCDPLCECALDTISIYPFLLYFIPRGSITLCIIGLAGYFAQKSNFHRKNAKLFRERAFALEAIKPFLDDIKASDSESLVSIKQKIVKNILHDLKK